MALMIHLMMMMVMKRQKCEYKRPDWDLCTNRRSIKTIGPSGGGGRGGDDDDSCLEDEDDGDIEGSLGDDDSCRFSLFF